jgi:hypothetical protein
VFSGSLQKGIRLAASSQSADLGEAAGAGARGINSLQDIFSAQSQKKENDAAKFGSTFFCYFSPSAFDRSPASSAEPKVTSAKYSHVIFRNNNYNAKANSDVEEPAVFWGRDEY